MKQGTFRVLMFAEMRDKHDIPLFVEEYPDDNDPSWLYETALWEQIELLIEARCLRESNGSVDFASTG